MLPSKYKGGDGMKEFEESIEKTSGNETASYKTIIVDKTGRIFKQSDDCFLQIEEQSGIDTIGAMIKCQNAENGICGLAPGCETCEIRNGLKTAIETEKKRSINVVKTLEEGRNALMDIDIIPFGQGQNKKIFVTINERDSAYMKIFLRDKENYLYEEFFYSNLDKLNLLIWSCDLNGNMRNMSNSLLKLLGISKEDMLHGKWNDHLLADVTEILDGFKDKEGTLETETKVVDGNGEHRWLLVRISEHNDHMGRVDGYIGKCTDITAIKIHQMMIDEKIREAEIIKKNTDDFIAKLSHESRTPLNGILGMTELLQRTELDTDQKEDVTIIKNSALNMLRLVNDMLDMTRIEAGKISLVSTKFNIDAIIKDTIKALEGQASGKGLKFAVEVSLKSNGIVIGDQDRIRQVLSNLISNAIKFTNYGTISVRVTSSRNKMMEDGMHNYHFEVEDTGIGISKDDFPKLFKNYSQITSSQQSKNTGLGLGLAISKGLVELMGGEIWAKNKVGKGACFVFELPLMSNERENKKVEEHAEPDVEEGLRALVAEDNEMNRLVIEKLLESMKYEVEIVGNGYEALKAFQSKTYDIIFMDIQMPIMDGLETTRKIREIENGERHIPIIAVTAFAIKGDREKFIETGMDGYVSKPISLNEMKKEINNVKDIIDKNKIEIANGNIGKVEKSEMEKLMLVASTEHTNIEIASLLISLKSALKNENETLSEGFIAQLREIAAETKNVELKDKLLKVAMSYRAGNYKKAIEYLN